MELVSRQHGGKEHAEPPLFFTSRGCSLSSLYTSRDLDRRFRTVSERKTLKVKLPQVKMLPRLCRKEMPYEQRNGSLRHTIQKTFRREYNNFICSLHRLKVHPLMKKPYEEFVYVMYVTTERQKQPCFRSCPEQRA
jgi:hypothetical protein